MTKVLIIGGVAGGSKTAAKLKRLKPDFDITIYTRERFVSYSACGLPFYIANTIRDVHKLIIRTVEEFEEKGINVKILHCVKRIIPETKQILIENLETNEEFYDNYDKLVIATGADPFVPNIKNYELNNVYTLRTLSDGVNIKNRLLDIQTATIVGGNYIGVELLESFIKQNVMTTIIEKNPTIMKFFDVDMGQIIQDNVKLLYPELSTLITNDTVLELNEKPEGTEVITRGGVKYITEMVVLAAGVRPAVKLAVESGIELGITGAIKVNNRMQTSIPDIWAVGDCAEKFHLVSKSPVWVPLGSTANKEGRVCALNIAGYESETFEGILGSSVLKYFGYTMSKTGLTEAQAIDAGFNAISTIITKLDKPKYMPDVKSITIKLVADRDTHKMLGVQIIGFGDADKRVNTMTAALLKDYTLEEFVNDDITYSPPLSTSIDPILTAVQVLIDKLNA